MRIINASVFVDGNFVKGGVDFDERIAAAGKMVTGDGYDAEGCLIIPGLVDIHTQDRKSVV